MESRQVEQIYSIWKTTRVDANRNKMTKLTSSVSFNGCCMYIFHPQINEFIKSSLKGFSFLHLFGLFLRIPILNFGFLWLKMSAKPKNSDSFCAVAIHGSSWFHLICWWFLFCGRILSFIPLKKAYGRSQNANVFSWLQNTQTYALSLIRRSLWNGVCFSFRLEKHFPSLACIMAQHEYAFRNAYGCVALTAFCVSCLFTKINMGWIARKSHNKVKNEWTIKMRAFKIRFVYI